MKGSFKIIICSIASIFCSGNAKFTDICLNNRNGDMCGLKKKLNETDF